MKYRLKSADVEAEIFDPPATMKIGDEHQGVRLDCFGDSGRTHFIIKTPEGHKAINPGDWIITNQAGSFPMKPSLFNALYEKGEP